MNLNSYINLYFSTLGMKPRGKKRIIYMYVGGIREEFMYAKEHSPILKRNGTYFELFSFQN